MLGLGIRFVVTTAVVLFAAAILTGVVHAQSCTSADGSTAWTSAEEACHKAGGSWWPVTRAPVLDVPLAVGPAQRAHKASRYAWPPLGQDKTIALGEALKALPINPRVVIWCPGSDCIDLQADLDDAFQIAGWDTDWDRRRIDSNEDPGLFVSPINPSAAQLAEAITKATGIHTTVVDGPEDGKTLNVIIGKRPR